MLSTRYTRAICSRGTSFRIAKSGAVALGKNPFFEIACLNFWLGLADKIRKFDRVVVLQNKNGTSGNSMLGALGMQLISKYANVAVQLVITMVLARLLTPEQYGTVAIVTVFTSFFTILSDLGVSTAIVQFKNLSKKDCNGLFFFSAILGAALAASFCLLSLPISYVYGDSILVTLCCVASLSILFNTLNMVPNGILMREKRFKSISIRLVVVSVTSGAVAILLAFFGFGCYALVWNSVLTAAFVFFWNWTATRLEFSNRNFMEPLKAIWRFSVFQGGFSIINYFARNLDNLLLGATVGTAALGYYDKAYKLMQYPLNYLTGIFSNVLQPYLSEFQNDYKRLYSSWLSICRILALVGSLVTAVFFCFSREIVLVMYGSQWIEAAPALTGLAISIGFQMVNSTSGAIFQSAGRTDSLFKSGLICTGVSILAIFCGVATGSLAALGAYISIAYVVHFCITAYLLVWKILGVSPRAFLRNFVPSIVAAAAGICASLLASSLCAGINAVVLMAMRVLACLAGYVVVILITREYRCVKAFKDMRNIGATDDRS